MSTKITLPTLSSIKATGKRFFIRDTQLRGFGIEVSAKGKATYYYEARRVGSGGSPVRRQIGSVELVPLQEARLQARAGLLQLSQGLDPKFTQQATETSPDTLSSAFQEYIQDRRKKLRPGTLKEYEKVLRKFSDWQRLPLAQLTEKMVTTRYNDLLDEHSPAYVNKLFRHLGAVVGSCRDPNPVRILTRKGIRQASNPRERFLSASEIAEIYEHAENLRAYGRSSYMLSLIKFYLLTGCRLKEALELTWQAIDDDTITIGTTKNGKSHAIPVSKSIKEILPTRKKPSDLVFNTTYSRFRYCLPHYHKIHGFTFTAHDLRRTFTNHADLIGFSSEDIGVAVNHSPKGITQTHYLGARLAKSNLMTEIIEGLSEQYNSYQRGYSGQQGKVPKDWLPPDMLEEPWTDQDLQAYAQDHE